MSYWAASELSTPSDYHVENFSISSDVGQTVYLSYYTYDEQSSQNGGCYDGTEGFEMWMNIFGGW